MKKIAFITECFPSEDKPYYCIYLYQQAKELINLGYEIKIIIPDRKLLDGEIKSDNFRGIETISIGYKSNKIKGLFNVTSVEFKKNISKILFNNRYDLISFSLCSYPIEMAIIKFAKKIKTLSVIHIHGLNVFDNPYVNIKKIIRLIGECSSKKILNNADGIIGVSDKVCEVVRTKINKEHIYTVYNGAEPKMFYPKADEKSVSSPFTILCVANMNEIKGWRYLIAAIRRICAEKPDIELRAKFIGKGPLEEELKTLSEGLPIEFMGEQDYPVVAEEMRNADFYIMPSYYEAIGCVYLEAMLSGTAALGVYGCGIDEIIQERINGYLVSPQNSDEIADCIKFAIENPEKHKEIAQKGYETVRDSYTWKHSAETLDKVFKKMLNENKEEQK